MSTAFDAANKLYDQGRFSDAAAAYEKLLQSGRASAALYFNLGNAAFKCGQIGRAIAAYRQAEYLAPRDPDVRANLQFARNQIQGPTLTPNVWQRWLGKLSLNEWTWLTASVFWWLLLVLILQQWRPTLTSRLRAPILILVAVTVLLGFCLGSALFQTRGTRTAVVIAREAVVRRGPLDESQIAFTVRDGAELRILDQKDDWLQVSTDLRRTGWLRRDQVLLSRI
ncbi:MAG TPA: tetratricopeptide repeat protein [Candidatus Sulfotelmatobacter sp.]|nr:tetratricopeptide repeat protein [Candidatus Sulfotelmatobacter sp.]